MPGHQAIPEWDTKSSTSIYEKPLTPFSKPRDAHVSNQDLLDALTPAAEVTLARAKSIGITITWWDAMSDGAFSCFMSLGEGVGKGRLGRPHELDDVPINYMRDRLMDWIVDDLEASEDTKQAARKAICPDLTDDEMEEYTRLIAQDNKKRKEEADRPPTPPTREEMAREILEHLDDVKTMDQATKIILMNEAVKEIDETVDWKTPKPMGIRRGPKDVEGSLVAPHPHWPLWGLEGNVVPDIDVDRDCDQVRAMIKTFVSSWDWSADTLRMALASNLTRAQFIAFLKKRGTDAAQLKSAAYLLSWQFFNRRQKIGLSVVGADFRDDYKTLEKNQHMESLSEPERVLVKAQEKELEALNEKYDKEFAALHKTQGERREMLLKTCVQRLKALAEERRLAESKGGSEKTRQNKGYSEKLRILADTEDGEIDALYKEHKKEDDALYKVRHQQEDLLVKAHAEQLRALTEPPPKKSKKRSLDNVGTRKSKRTRSSR